MSVNEVKVAENMKQTYDQCTNITNEIVTNTTQKLSTDATTIQKIEVHFSNANVRCKGDSNLGNKAVTKLNALVSMKADKRMQVANDIASQIVAKLQAEGSQVNSGINLGQLNTSILDQSVRTDLQTDIKNAITDNLTTMSNSIVQGSQTLKWEIKDSMFYSGDMCDVQNESDTVTFSRAVLDQVLATSSNTDIQAFASTLEKSKVDQENKGILSFLSNPWSSLMWIGIVIVIIIIIGVVVKMKKNNNTSTSGSSGKSKSALVSKAIKM